MSVFNRPSSPPEERRAEPRRRVDARGLILADGQEILCLIVDVSDGGLKVRVDRVIGLPPVIVVVDMGSGTACEAEVRWARGQELGLKCRIRATSLNGLVPGRLTPARDAWLRRRSL
jgi:hypothetical protein